MTNAERYHFSDFTHQNYRRLVRLAKECYTFGLFTDFEWYDRVILWRHDVDVSMQAARKLAIIEHEENVKATYFLHLHSDFYNLLQRDVAKCVQEILDLGHQIGLHFDCHFYDLQVEEQLDGLLMREKRLLEEFFGQPIHAFSFHQTTPFTMNCRRLQYAGLINAYSDFFQTQFGYCSDSNGYWRFRRLEDVLRLAKDSRLQVLTHDVWWSETVLSPRERIKRCIDGRAAKTWQNYETTLKDFGRENVDWE